MIHNIGNESFTTERLTAFFGSCYDSLYTPDTTLTKEEFITKVIEEFPGEEEETDEVTEDEVQYGLRALVSSLYN
jgi:hypothetical protein